MSSKQSVVVITRAPKHNYQKDYVALPKEYGTPKYFARADIQSIQNTVKVNLTQLNERTDFLSELKGKKVLIKPNLVIVLHKFGLEKENYPESTDPRVIDALVHFIKPYAKEIIIAEKTIEELKKLKL